MTRLWKFILLVQVSMYGALGLWAISYSARSLDSSVAAKAGFFTEEYDVQGRRKVLSLSPDSSLNSDGVREGDYLEFERSADQGRLVALDERIPVRWISGLDGQTRHLIIRPIALSKQELGVRQVDFVVYWIIGFITLAAGLLVGLRRADSRSMRALSQVMLAWIPWLLMFYMPPGATQSIFSFLHAAYASTFYVFFLYFALTYPHDLPLRTRRWARVLFVAVIAYQSCIQGYLMMLWLDWFEPSLWFPHNAMRFSAAISITAISIALLSMSWRRSSGMQRERLAWVTLSMGVAFSTYLLGNLEGLIDWTFPWYGCLRNIIVLAAHIALMYGILRHRILDFGLAINRVLIYTITSSFLLVLFAFIEFSVDKLLHFSSRQQSIIVDATVALVVILTFHRVQEFIRHRIDHTFFHRWYEAAERLRQFIARAEHFTESEVLQARFIAAIDEFTDASGSSIYWRQDHGLFQLQHNTLANAVPHLDSDHPLLIELKYNRTAVRMNNCSLERYGELAFPLFMRDALTGILVVGPRNSGHAYRPDQIDELTKSAKQIGLHLEKQKIIALESAISVMHEAQMKSALECLQLQLELTKLKLSMPSS